MDYKKSVIEFFRAADSLDPVALSRLLTDDVAWTFGNAPTLHGRKAVIESLTGFFTVITSMSHRIVGIWQAPDAVTVETAVRYGDHHGRSMEFRGCDVLFYRQGLVSEVRIFVDNHELFIPPAKA